MASPRVKNVSKETIVQLASVIVDPNSTPNQVSKAMTELVMGILQNEGPVKQIQDYLNTGLIEPSTFVLTKNEYGIYPPYEAFVDTADRIVNLYGKLNP